MFRTNAEIREAARQHVREEGLREGLTKGREEGMGAGMEAGMEEGIKIGRQEGIDEGIEIGEQRAEDKLRASLDEMAWCFHPRMPIGSLTAAMARNLEPA